MQIIGDFIAFADPSPNPAPDPANEFEVRSIKLSDEPLT